MPSILKDNKDNKVSDTNEIIKISTSLIAINNVKPVKKFSKENIIKTLKLE
jgi:hypothetical protein